MRLIRLRKIWLISHRWLGLTFGLLLILSGSTGSLLVFRTALDVQLNPEIFSVAPGESRCSIEDVIRAAEASPVAQLGKISFVDFPRSESGVWTVWFQTGTKESPQLTKAYFDPYRAQMTGQRKHGADLMTWIYKLHVDLFAGHLGETIVGITGIVLLISGVTGILLWWPLWKHSWRAALAIRRGARFNYDVHKTGGVISGGVLFVVAFTGVYLTFPTWIAPVVRSVLPASEQTSGKPVSKIPDGGGTRIWADQAFDAVKNRIPDAEIRRIHPPTAPNGTFIVRFCETGDVHRTLGSSRAWVDQYSGEILAVRSSKSRSAAETFLSWQLPLHNGEAFGLLGRWLVFISGIALSLLSVTGFLIWWRKRQSSYRQRSIQTRNAATVKSSSIS